MLLSGEDGSFLADDRSRNRRRGDNQYVNARFVHSKPQLLNEKCPKVYRLQVRGCENVGSHLQACAYVFTVVGSATGKVPRLLMVVGRLCPGDLIAVLFRFVEERN